MGIAIVGVLAISLCLALILVPVGEKERKITGKVNSHKSSQPPLEEYFLRRFFN
jgi:hypothetical protein